MTRPEFVIDYMLMLAKDFDELVKIGGAKDAIRAYLKKTEQHWAAEEAVQEIAQKVFTA